MLIKGYTDILVKGLIKFLRSETEKNEIPQEEDLRLVIKIQKGSLGAFLYNGSKFMRKVDFAELVKLLF